MSEVLRSVGLDVGTTSTQMILSELTVENRASAFAVPEMAITNRKILYRSPIHFTPLLDESHMDGPSLRRIVEEEYRKAGITRESVDTGAIIITGETSRKENARTVLHALSDLAGDFVVATAGPDLESILAARGAGAVAWSEHTGKTVLHMDIGGGTSNLALIEAGKITHTGCLNVGGRLMKFDENGKITYISPVISQLSALKIVEIPTPDQLSQLTRILVQALEMAAGLREETDILSALTTQEATSRILIPQTRPVISFSGGVADCIEQNHPPFRFGDMGPMLGRAIRESRLCSGEYILGSETIRATVIGAGCHSTQLSGSTVFCQNVKFPLKNLPVAHIQTPTQIRWELSKQEGPVILAMEGLPSPTYPQITALAEQIISQTSGQILLCIEQDMAKALGQALAARLPPATPILCIDRVRVGEGSYLDIAAPISHALPVVVKTLVLTSECREAQTNDNESSKTRSTP